MRSHNTNANPNSIKNSPYKGFDNSLGHSDHSSQTNNSIIIQVNVEGLTRAKCECLQKLAVEQSEAVLFLQEKTYIPTNIVILTTTKFLDLNLLRLLHCVLNITTLEAGL